MTPRRQNVQNAVQRYSEFGSHKSRRNQLGNGAHKRRPFQRQKRPLTYRSARTAFLGKVQFFLREMQAGAHRKPVRAHEREFNLTTFSSLLPSLEVNQGRRFLTGSV